MVFDNRVRSVPEDICANTTKTRSKHVHSAEYILLYVFISRRKKWPFHEYFFSKFSRMTSTESRRLDSLIGKLLLGFCRVKWVLSSTATEVQCCKYLPQRHHRYLLRSRRSAHSGPHCVVTGYWWAPERNWSCCWQLGSSNISITVTLK